MANYTGLQPWDVSVDGFPIDGAPADQLFAGLAWAVLAPSGHNTQPWLFRPDGDGMEVIADRSRALAVVDPDDRELIMSCAAAVTNLGVALRRFGRNVAVVWFPDAHNGDVVARVSIMGDVEPSAVDVALFDAINNRHTNRGPFAAAPIPDATLADLANMAVHAGGRLVNLVGDAKAAVADLIAEGDRRQMADKNFRRELASWVHHNRTNQLDGMRGYGFKYGDVASHVGPHMIRRFDLGNSQAAKDHQLASQSPALMVIATKADSPSDWVTAGGLLERILLRLTADGFAASFLNQPIENPELREDLGTLVNVSGVPQLLFRAGLPTEHQPHTPRIPASARLV